MISTDLKLEPLIEAITKIDGGCPNCIAEFLRRSRSAFPPMLFDVILKDVSGKMNREFAMQSFDEEESENEVP